MQYIKDRPGDLEGNHHQCTLKAQEGGCWRRQKGWVRLPAQSPQLNLGLPEGETQTRSGHAAVGHHTWKYSCLEVGPGEQAFQT